MKTIYLFLFIIIIFCTIIYVTCPNLHFNNTSTPFFVKDIKERAFFARNNHMELINKPYITIMCTSGLTNRLSTLLSFSYVCRQYKKDLHVIWIKNKTCECYFDDYFKDIKGVTVYRDYTDDDIFFTGQCEFYKLLSHFKLPYKNSILLEMLNLIRLKQFLYTEIKQFVCDNNVHERIGVHVRRTDLTGNLIGKILNGSNCDEEFFKFIGRKKSFIATDNRETQLLYKNKYKNNIMWFRNISYNNNLRKTSIKNAIIDLYILSYCAKIKGTKNSRFSEFSLNLKKSRLL